MNGWRGECARGGVHRGVGTERERSGDERNNIMNIITGSSNNDGDGVFVMNGCRATEGQGERVAQERMHFFLSCVLHIEELYSLMAYNVGN